MDAEVIKLLKELADKGPTYGFWVVAFGGLVGSAIGAYFGAYLKKLGEQHFLNERFNLVLGQMQAQVKATEEIKAGYSKDVSDHAERLARQSKLIEAQAQLLDELTATLWAWRYLTMRVAYYGRQTEQDKYDAAVKAYETRIWDVLSKFRSQASKSRRLVSENVHKRLVGLYDHIVDKLDPELHKAIASPDHADALADLNFRLRFQETENLDELLDAIADEVGLKARTKAAQSGPNEAAAQPALAGDAPRAARP